MGDMEYISKGDRSFLCQEKKKRNKKYIRRGEEYQPIDPGSANSHTQGVYYMVYNITPGSLEYYQVVYAYMCMYRPRHVADRHRAFHPAHSPLNVTTYIRIRTHIHISHLSWDLPQYPTIHLDHDQNNPCSTYPSTKEKERKKNLRNQEESREPENRQLPGSNKPVERGQGKKKQSEQTATYYVDHTSGSMYMVLAHIHSSTSSGPLRDFLLLLFITHRCTKKRVPSRCEGHVNHRMRRERQRDHQRRNIDFRSRYVDVPPRRPRQAESSQTGVIKTLADKEKRKESKRKKENRKKRQGSGVMMHARTSVAQDMHACIGRGTAPPTTFAPLPLRYTINGLQTFLLHYSHAKPSLIRARESQQQKRKKGADTAGVAFLAFPSPDLPPSLSSSFTQSLLFLQH